MKNILIAAFLFVSVALSARPSFLGGETSISGGISGFHYKNVNGNPSMSAGTNGDLSFFWLLNKKWTFGIGVGADHFRSEMKIKQFQGQTPYIKYNGTRFLFSYAYKDYTESLRMTMLTIPIEMLYEFSNTKIALSNNMQFIPHASFGLKFGMIIYNAYNAEGTLTTKGSFADRRGIVEDAPDQGFEPNFTVSHYGDFGLDLKPAVILSLKVGVSHTMLNEDDLILSLYCDVGLNNLNKITSKPPVEWVDLGILDLGYLDYRPIATSSSNEKLIPFAFGLRLTYAAR